MRRSTIALWCDISVPIFLLLGLFFGLSYGSSDFFGNSIFGFIGIFSVFLFMSLVLYALSEIVEKVYELTERKE